MVEFKFLNHCGFCAGKLSKVNDTVYRCQSCNKETYNGPSSAAGVVVFDGDKVLVSRRSIDPGKGHLDIIGGFLNFNESPEDGARREFKEETGAELISLRLVDASKNLYTPNVSTCDLLYLGELAEGAELKPNDDIDELLWMSINELQEADFENKPLLRNIQKAYKLHLENMANQ